MGSTPFALLVLLRLVAFRNICHVKYSRKHNPIDMSLLVLSWMSKNLFISERVVFYTYDIIFYLDSHAPQCVYPLFEFSSSPSLSDTVSSIPPANADACSVKKFVSFEFRSVPLSLNSAGKAVTQIFTDHALSFPRQLAMNNDHSAHGQGVDPLVALCLSQSQS